MSDDVFRFNSEIYTEKKACKTAHDKEECPIKTALKLISRKWVLQIICILDKNGHMRYGQLKQELPEISDLMLSRTLKELQNYGFLERKQYEEIPPRVEYNLSQKGKHILPTFNQVAEWGLEIMEADGINCTCMDKCFVKQHKYLYSNDLELTQEYPDKWDYQYSLSFEKLFTDELCNMSVYDKLIWYLHELIHILTIRDIDVNSRILVYFSGLSNPDLTNHDRPLYHYLTELIEMGQQEGSLRNDTPAIYMTECLVNILNGIELQYLLGDPSGYDENTARIDWIVDSMMKIK